MAYKKSTARKDKNSYKSELIQWPYTIHQIDDTLDLSLIEGRGKQILFQSLNSKNLTAFAGSGLSAAYGRMDWTTWKTTQLSVVTHLSNTFVKVSEAALDYTKMVCDCLISREKALLDGTGSGGKPNPEEAADIRLTARWLQHRGQVMQKALSEIQNLSDTFTYANSDNGSFPGGEDMPVMFEIAKKLHDMLVHHRRLFISDPDPRERFENLTKMFGTAVNPLNGLPIAHIDKLFADLKKEHTEEELIEMLGAVLVLDRIGQQRLVELGKEFRDAYHAYRKVADKPESQMDFHQLAKVLLVDECPHAENLFFSGIEYGSAVGRDEVSKKITDYDNLKSGFSLKLTSGSPFDVHTELRKHFDVASTLNLKREVDGIRDAPERYRILRTFRIETTENMLLETSKDGPPDWQPLTRTLHAYLKNYSDRSSALDAERKFLTPTSRFLVPMLMQLIKDPLKDGLVAWDKMMVPQPNEFESRRSIMADRLDPLNKIISKFKINSFLTTNYDFEIERQYLDRGYLRFDTHGITPAVTAKTAAANPRSFRTDGLGSVMKDLTFDADTATDLISFAAGGDGADASIFHLHGRAVESEDIIVTERDYMNQYLRSDGNRQIIDECILTAFAATPMLFLGLGMEEADVLRPLRQFNSDQDRSVGYRSIVLMGADKGIEERAKTAAGLYMRYGAHTIFFGGGDIKFTFEGSAFPNNQPIDWLNRITNLLDGLGKALKCREKEMAELVHAGNGKKPPKKISDPENEANKPVTTIAALRKAVGKIGSDLETDNFDKETWALDILLGQNLDGVGATSIPDLEVQNCTLTSTRHGGADASSSSRSIRFDATNYTGFYTTVLTGFLRMALSETEHANIGEAIRSARAMRIGINALQGAFRTATLNATLTNLSNEWRTWWRDWQEEPPLREARFETVHPDADMTGNLDPGIVMPKRLVRHRIVNAITDLRHCDRHYSPQLQIDHMRQIALPFDRCTGIRVFDTFIYNVANVGAECDPHHGRVIHTLAAPRGHGKGAFFSAFNTPLGLSSYIRAAHPNAAAGGRGPRPAFVSAAFVNISFSAEIASTFEMMLKMLVDALATVKLFEKFKGTLSIKLATAIATGSVTGLKDRETTKYNKITGKDGIGETTHESNVKDIEAEIKGLKRLDKLRMLTIRFREAANNVRQRHGIYKSGISPRILIAINGIELLYDRAGQPKNLEIAEIMRFFASSASRNIPVDLILVGDFARIGRPWNMPNRKNGTESEIVSPVMHIHPELLQQRVIAAVQSQATDFGLPLDRSAKGKSTRDYNFVHTARVVEPRTFMTDNFLLLSFSLYLARQFRVWGRSSLGDDAAANDLRENLTRDLYKEMENKRDEVWFRPEPPDVGREFEKTKDRMEQNLVSRVDAANILDLENDPQKVPDWITDESQIKIYRLRKILQSDYNLPKYADDLDDWNNLRKVLEGNRFCLTILLAAAEHVVFAHSDLLKGGAAANRLLRDVVTSLRNSSPSHREEVVLEAVMAVYSDTSRIGEAEMDFSLHKFILRNLAVLGCPVSPNVIVRLPDIRAYFNKVGMSGRLSRRRTVARALAILSQRGLLFRLSPHPKLLRLDAVLNEQLAEYNHALEKEPWVEEADKYTSVTFLEYLQKKAEAAPELEPLISAYRAFQHWHPQKEYRYAPHRQIVNHTFHRLGNLTAAPISTNNFAPTLYASVPSRVIRLSKEGYLFLRGLMLGLSQYPDVRHEDAARDKPIFRDDNVITQVQALRAAMSLARTSFSVAAVSRFDDETTGMGFIRKRGYFETYKVRLRWILRKAWDIHEPRQQPDNLSLRVNALYQDEIVWLYNEIAVTCLVQGNLVDAVAHIRQSIYVNAKIEGKSAGGHMHNMLALNHALIQIERGRLKSAQAILNGILASERRVQRRVYHLADGYLGVIAHLKGLLPEARKRLNAAIKGLDSSEEDRALAILYMHLARLTGQTDPESAKPILTIARDHAETGGHEDIRHRIIATEVWLSQTQETKTTKQLRADQVKLEQCRHYATMMGSHSLQVEMLHLQGRMLLSAGDSSSSGKVLARAMAIARRNDMALKLNNVMTTYAQVLIARRRIPSAMRLLDASLATAKRSGYSNEVVRIHQVIEDAEQRGTR